MRNGSARANVPVASVAAAAGPLFPTQVRAELAHAPFFPGRAEAVVRAGLAGGRSEDGGLKMEDGRMTRGSEPATGKSPSIPQSRDSKACPTPEPGQGEDRKVKSFPEVAGGEGGNLEAVGVGSFTS